MAKMSIGRAFQWHAERDPDRVSVRDGDTAVTRRELDRRSNVLARAYIGLGVGVDDMVTIALPNSILPRFDAGAALAAIERHRVTWMLLVPTMMHRIWRLPAEVRRGYDVSSIEALIHLGARCPPWLKRAWIDWLGPDRVTEVYAGTESQGVTFIGGRDWLSHPGSVGRAAPGFEFRILDERCRPVPAGTVGEIFMMPDGGPGSTYRYVGAEARSVDGWESLGDLGHMDTEGYLYIADRSADLILAGGANVYPAEVEAVIDEHPAVRSSVVVGLPDDDLGERVHAIVDTAGSALDPTDLLGWVGGRLARYKVPRSVEVVDGVLRDDSGKVRRSELRRLRLPHGEPRP